MLKPLTLLLTTTTALTGLTTAALTPPTLLAPWRITALSTHSPSGYPASHPYSRLGFSIADPNTITLGTTPYGDARFLPHGANCSVVWLAYGPDPRTSAEGGGGGGGGGGGKEGGGGSGSGIGCGDGGELRGKWAFEVVDGVGEGGGSATTDFGLRVRLEEAVVLATGAVVNLRFEGEVVLFRVGDNMAGACGGSSVCNWGLKKESAPVLVKQTLVEMECVAGDCDIEGEA